MKELIKEIESSWYKNPGCSIAILTDFENLINQKLSEPYKNFMLWSNGGEGQIGENYISLWKIENIRQLNIDYNIPKYLTDNLLAFGTDGGDVCFGFNFINNQSIFSSPLGDLDFNEIKNIATSFDLFIKKAIFEVL